MTNLNLGQRVRLSKTYSTVTEPKGTIRGFGHLIRNEKTFPTRREHSFPIYLVELDEEFYSEDKTIWVSILPVHHDSVSPIE